MAERPRGNRLGESAGGWRHVDQLGFFAQTASGQPPISQEGELQRGDRAFDRQLANVDDQPPAFKLTQRVSQCHCAFERIEVEHPLAPIAAQHAFSLAGGGFSAGGDD